MQSPVTGTQMVVKKEFKTLSHRGQERELLWFFLEDEKGNQFETSELSALNLWQVYAQSEVVPTPHTTLSEGIITDFTERLLKFDKEILVSMIISNADTISELIAKKVSK